MANQILTLALSRELLSLLKHRFLHQVVAVFAEATSSGARRGDTVMFREPVILEPWGRDPFRPIVQQTAVVLGHQATAEFQLDHGALTQSIDQLSQAHLERAASDIAQQVIGAWPFGATLVTACMELIPNPQYRCQRETDLDSGLSIRCVSTYDAVNDIWRFRADMLFGFHGEGLNVESPFVIAPVAAEMISLLLEAKAEWAAQLTRLKLAA